MRPAAVNGILLLASTIALVGCGGSSPMIETPPSKPVPPAVASLQGVAFGGQQPVTGMTLQLYDAGSGGYGSPATGLLATPLPTTDSSGNFRFHIPTCPNGSDQVYLVGTGGDPMAAGQGSGKNNSSLALMVALGNCSGLSSLPGLHMNELTTVAAVWALAPFMSGNTNAYQTIGTSSGNALGLQMAFAAAQEVASVATGTVPGSVPSGATVEADEVNTVADVLEACINSIDAAGPAPSSSCSSLFSDAPSTAGNPADTITAAMNIAQHPAQHVTALTSLISNTPTFNPVVSTPTAFTMAITYASTGGLSTPTAVATDQAGNIWVTNSAASPTVSLFANNGAVASGFPASGASLPGAPGGIAIDLTGNAWITIPGNNNVVEVNSSGTVTTNADTTGLNDPTSIAIDGGGNIWVVNSASGANSVSGFNSGGQALTGSPFLGGGISSPVAIAINGNANANCSNCH